MISFSELQSLPFFEAVLTVWRQHWILLASGLAAGFVDSLGGGGGLITVPAFLTAGVPNAFLLGTNKCTSALGTSVAVARYGFAGLLPHLSISQWLRLILAALLCAMFGAVLSQLPTVLEHLHILIPAVLFAVMAFLAKRWFWDPRHGGAAPLMETDQEVRRAATRRLLSFRSTFAIGVVGAYDGIFGPGAGAFFLSYLEKIGFSTIQANAVTKILNLSSNLGALVFFAWQGRVLWPVSIAVAAGYMLGNYVGSGFVLRKGQSVVRATVMCMTTLMLCRYLWYHSMI